jgi:hypothetical protein
VDRHRSLLASGHARDIPHIGARAASDNTDVKHAAPARKTIRQETMKPGTRLQLSNAVHHFSPCS